MENGSRITYSQGFGELVKKLQKNNPKATEKDLSLLFLKTLENNDDKSCLDVNKFSQILNETYNLNENSSESEEILNILDAIAKNDGVENKLTLGDFEKQAEFENILSNNKTKQALISMLENLVSSQEESLNATKENNGVIAGLWDKFKNKTGLGMGSDKVQTEIDKLKEEIEKLKSGKEDLAEVYKDITGNELNKEEFDKLIQGTVDFSKSDFLKTSAKYQQGQKQAVNTISGISSALAITGLVASGIFTGGLSVVAAGAICIAGGTAAYMAPQALDGLTEKDGYSGVEIAQDLATGLIDSTVQTVTLGSAKGMTNALIKATGKETLGKFLGTEATALMLGDGMALGNYFAEAGATRLDDLSLSKEDKEAYEKITNGEIQEGDEGWEEALEKANKYYSAISNNSDFSLEGLTTTAATATTASLAAGGTAFLAQGTLGQFAANATQNSAASVQIGTKLAVGGATGALTGASASFVGGGVNYLLTTDGKDITFEDWLNASTENVKSGALIGFGTGFAFEAVQISAGTMAPEGTKKTITYKSENGTVKEYLDADGNIIARDISSKDLNAYLKSNETLVEYGNNPESAQQGTRTVRFNFQNANIEQINYWNNQIQLSANQNSSQNTQEVQNTINSSNKEISTTTNNAQLSIQEQILAPGLILTQGSENLILAGTLAGLAASSLAASTTATANDVKYNAAGIANNTNSTNLNQEISKEELTAIISKKLEENGVLENMSQRRADRLIANTVKVVECIPERLNESGIKFDIQAVLDIMDAGNYYYTPELALTSLTGMKDKEYIGRAFVLAQMINNGVISVESVENITNYNMPAAFNEAFNKNLANNNSIDYFDEILKANNISEEEITIIKEIANGIKDGKISTQSLQDINWSDIKNGLDSTAQTLMKGGISISEIYQYKDVFDYEAFLSQTDDSYFYNISKLQNSDKALLIATKITSSSDNPQEASGKDNVSVIKTVTMDENGNIIKSTTFQDETGSAESWYYASNKTTIINTKEITTKGEAGDVLSSQIEIVNDEKEPYILYTKESEILKGAWETTKYNLNDYPKDMDVLAAIKDGSIEGGEKLSNITQNSNSIEYNQNYTQNGNNINRNYSQQTDKNGNIISKQYQYLITSENSEELMSLNRSWVDNQNNTTTTNINGKTYTASFNDETREITITTNNEEEIKYSLDEHIKAGNSQEEKDKFWALCKTMPADELISLSKNVKQIEIIDDILDSQFMTNGNLRAGCDSEILAHELGHAKDTDNQQLGKISKNEELIEIYNKEMKNFTEQYPEIVQGNIQYFSQFGGGLSNDGLSELVAETNMLMTTYGHNEDAVCARSEYLVKYFPETVAKIADLLGYNANCNNESKNLAIADFNENLSENSEKKVAAMGLSNNSSTNTATIITSNDWEKDTFLPEFDNEHQIYLKINDTEINLTKYYKAFKNLDGDENQAISLKNYKDLQNKIYKADGLKDDEEIIIYGNGSIKFCSNNDDARLEICEKTAKPEIKDITEYKYSFTPDSKITNMSREEKLEQLNEIVDFDTMQKIKTLDDKELGVLLQNKDFSKAIDLYKSDAKRGFKAINKALREYESGTTITDEATINSINSITESIAEHGLENGVTLYRYDGYEALKNLNTNGEKISQGEKSLALYLEEMSKNYSQTGNEDEILNFLLKFNKKINFSEPSFISTNIGEHAQNFDDKPLAMELETKNANGIAIIEPNRFGKTELEVLLQRNSEINCTIDYDFETRKWILTGTVGAE